VKNCHQRGEISTKTDKLGEESKTPLLACRRGTVAQRAKRVYAIDPGPYRQLIEDFLLAAASDSSYGVAIARTAQTIRAKRKRVEEEENDAVV
jgi:hypothetical protein